MPPFLTALRGHGYDVGDPVQIPVLLDDDSDALMHALIEAGGQDPAWLTDEVLAANPIRVAAADYRDWFVGLPADLRGGVGIRSMQERAEELGGELLLQSAPGQGTTVTAILPL